jgi:MFS family permease
MILGMIFLIVSISLVVALYNYLSILLASALSGLASALFSSNAVMAVVEVGSVTGERRPEISFAHAGLASGSGWFSGLFIGGFAVKALGLRKGLILGVPILIAAISLLFISRGPLIQLERDLIVKPYMIFLGVAERIRLLFYYISKMANPIKRDAKVFYDPFNSYLMVMMLAFFAISLFFTQIPVFMRKVVGVPNSDVMILMSIHNAISTIFFALLGFRLIKVKPKIAIELAFGLRSFAFILPISLGLLTSYKIVYPVTFIITGATWALISVSMNTLALDLGGYERGGERLGQLNGSTGLGLLLGSFLSGIIVSTLGYTINFVLASLIISLALIWLAKLLR